MCLMQKSILLAAFIFNAVAVQAQNLIANPGFEDVNICTEFNAPCNPSAWESVAPESMKIQYMYHSYKTSGNSLIRVSSSSPATMRNYAQSQLLCALEKGRKYRFTILAATENGNPPEIDVRFDTTWTYRMKAVTLGELKPTLRTRKEDVTKAYQSSPLKFYLLQQEFTADDAYTHIVIGNFDKKNFNNEVSAFMIDSVAIEATDHNGPLCTDAQQVKQALYARHDRHTVPSEFYRRLENPAARKPSEMDCFTVTVKDERIFSAAGRAQQPAEAARIDSVVRLYDGSLRIKVHITGYSYEDNSVNYNQVRSVDKAKRIGEILAYKHGFSFNDITWDGKGNRLPRFDTNTPEGREQNNFVDIEFCFPASEKKIIAPPPPPQPDTLVIPDVLFKFNSAELNNKLYGVLDSLIQRIPRNEVIQLQLAGHTDNAGTDVYNLDLSHRRATAVAEYLKQKGLGQYIRHVSGLGESTPVEPNDTPEGRKKNRRVEIIIYKGSD